MKESTNQLGILNEVGDLGLGFNPITEDEEKQMKKDEEE